MMVRLLAVSHIGASRRWSWHAHRAVAIWTLAKLRTFVLEQGVADVVWMRGVQGRSVEKTTERDERAGQPFQQDVMIVLRLALSPLSSELAGRARCSLRICRSP